MLLSSRSLQFIGAATPNRTFRSAMSSYSFSARGRNQWRRGFCDRRPPRSYGGPSEVDAFVSGDSHVGDVRAANYGHRHSYPQQQFRPWRPSPPPFRAGPPPKSADHRNWIFAASQPPPDREHFKVLSYNILADYLALDHHSNLYFHIPDHILAWEWRKRRLFIEFGLWSPDIMCLQEVDQFCDLEGELAIRGYTGIWKMRTGNAVDGCAIFWRTNSMDGGKQIEAEGVPSHLELLGSRNRLLPSAGSFGMPTTSKFQLKHEEHIEFSKLGLRDNVAQICVLESKMRFPENAALPSSYNTPSRANQVVVCNTHVLYNPKRGEIKLGQVRILLDRAFTVSRAWNDAPVIVCGDFNSIPMSPLYRFIATQKLNLSGLARDQISGQYSATLQRRPNSSYSSYRPQTSSRYAGESTFGAEEGYCRTRSDNQHSMGNSSPIKESAVTLYQNVEQKSHGRLSSGAATIKLGAAEILSHQMGEVSLTPSELANMPSRTSELRSQQSIICTNINADKIREEAHKNILDEPFSEGHNVSPGSGDLEDEIKLTSTSCMNNSTVSPSQNTVNFQTDVNNVPNPPSFHSDKDDFSKMDSSKEDDTSSEEKPCTACASLEMQMVENTENSSTGSAVMVNAGSLVTCQNSSKGNGLDLYNFDGSHVSNRMDVLSCIEDEQIMDNMNSVGDGKKVASNEILEEIPALCGNFSRDATLNENTQCSKLSALDENEDSQSPEMIGLEENADPNFFKELLGMEDDNQSMKDVNSPNLELREDSSFPIASSAFNVERHFYDPYCWSPMEMEISSGNAKCTVVEHPLKLRSVYTDVEDQNRYSADRRAHINLKCAQKARILDYTGTKDSNREPQVTSYNQRFMGTVDYIWCSQDLQTVKVLDTIPKHVLQRTPGFPTQKWGSDHIALACELAFSKI